MGGTSGKMIKKRLKEVYEISPYNEMNNVDVNFEKITDLIVLNEEQEHKKYIDNPYLQTEKAIIDVKEVENMKNGVSEQAEVLNIYKFAPALERVFSEGERKYLTKMFLVYSSDGIMSNRQFWSFLDLEAIYTTTFAKLFYKAACDFNDNSKLEYLKFMDEFKFLQIIGVFAKNCEIEIEKTRISLKDLKIRFLFSIFDTDSNEEIDRLEFRNLITSFIEMVLSIKFDSEGLQDKIRLLNMEAGNVPLMEKVLDQYVDEVFLHFSYSGELLSFDEWQKWLFTFKGIENILNFSNNLKEF